MINGVNWYILIQQNKIVLFYGIKSFEVLENKILPGINNGSRRFILFNTLEGWLGNACIESLLPGQSMETPGWQWENPFSLITKSFHFD